MSLIQTILYPTDFSERSEYAFPLACALARDYGARVIALHVMPPPLIAYGGGPLPAEPERYQQSLNEKLQGMIARAAGARFEQRMVEGDAAAEILRVAAEVPCDLIVMGSHGRTGVGRLLLGSVAEQVLRQAVCPLLIVKQPLRQTTDFLEKSGAAIEEIC